MECTIVGIVYLYTVWQMNWYAWMYFQKTNNQENVNTQQTEKETLNTHPSFSTLQSLSWSPLHNIFTTLSSG